MRRLTYFIACTADRFIAATDGSWKGFLPPQGEWWSDILAAFPETIPGHLRGQFGVQDGNKYFDTVLMGRNTYEVGVKEGITSPYPHLKQFVFSRSMKASPRSAFTLVKGDPVGLVKRLKAQSGQNIWLCGGGELAAGLHSEIDELILKIHPVVFGAGIPLFGGPVGQMHLQLVECRTYPDGFMLVHYHRR